MNSLRASILVPALLSVTGCGVTSEDFVPGALVCWIYDKPWSGTVEGKPFPLHQGLCFNILSLDEKGIHGRLPDFRKITIQMPPHVWRFSTIAFPAGGSWEVAKPEAERYLEMMKYVEVPSDTAQ